MKTKNILRFTGLFALVWLLTAISISSAFADDPTGVPGGLPWPQGSPWPTAQPLTLGVPWSPGTTYSVPPAAPAIVPYVAPAPYNAPSPMVPPVVVTIPSPVPPAVNALPLSAPVTAPTQNVASGTSPSNPLQATGTWRTLDAGASLWYTIGNGGVHLEVFLDAVPESGVSMAIYAPNQFGKPIGRGTPWKNDPARLVWAGGHWNAEGNWLALVSNGNPMPIRLKLSSTQQNIGGKTCGGYWEYIGTDYVFWPICQ